MSSYYFSPFFVTAITQKWSYRFRWNLACLLVCIWSEYKTPFLEKKFTSGPQMSILILKFQFLSGVLVWLGFFVPLENISLIRRRHHCRWRAANFDLCSALMAIKEWGFFSVPHLLWHGASVYNDHLRGPVTLTPIAELVAVELSLPVFYDLGLPRLGILFECYIKINIHV